jgi:hypothetical protein
VTCAIEAPARLPGRSGLERSTEVVRAYSLSAGVVLLSGGFDLRQRGGRLTRETRRVRSTDEGPRGVEAP